MAREVELKFAVPEEFRLPELADPDAGIAACLPGPTRELRAVYVDAADLRLARAGVTLRYRVGERPARWTLKLPVPDDDATVRDEVDVAGRAGDVPRELRDALAAWLRDEPLVPVAALTTARATWLMYGPAGEPLGEVVDDAVSVVEGDRVAARFREVEVEAHALDPLARDAVARRLVTAGAVAGEFVPKAVRALGPRAAAPPDLPLPDPVRPSSPAGAVVAAALRADVRRLLVHDVGVRLDVPDAVHRMRIACRRIRGELRAFAPLVDAEWAAGLRAELAWLARELGPARDLEVVAARLPRTAGADAEHPVPAEQVDRLVAAARERRTAALAGALAALRSDRHLALVDRLVAAAREPALTGAAEEKARRALPPLVEDAWRALARRARRLGPDAPAEELHRVRIRAKRARYVAEACAPALGAKAARTAAAALRAQQLLGEAQDAAVAAAFALDVAAAHADDGALCLAAGRLAEREHALARRARAELVALWPDLDRPGRRG